MNDIKLWHLILTGLILFDIGFLCGAVWANKERLEDGVDADSAQYR